MAFTIIAAEAQTRPPATIGSVPSGDESLNVTVSGDHAYLADGKAGLQIINIRDLANPTKVAGIDSLGRVADVAVSGDHAFVAGEEEMSVVDISDPTTPTQVGSLDSSVQSIFGLTVHGNRAFLADRVDGLVIVDIEDPTNPTKLGSLDPLFGSYLSAIQVAIGAAGDYAFVGLTVETSFLILISELWIVDIRDPHNPTRVGSYRLDNDGSPIYGIAVSGGYAYVSANGQMLAFDIESLTEPVVAGIFNSATGKVDVQGDRAYVGGLKVIDISDPTEMRHLEEFETNGEVLGLAGVGITVLDDIAFVAAGHEGLQIIDIRSTEIALTPLPLNSDQSNRRLRLEGPAGRQLQIQCSEDLLRWQDWQLVTLDGQPVEVGDPDTESQHRFYRLLNRGTN